MELETNNMKTAKQKTKQLIWSCHPCHSMEFANIYSGQYAVIRMRGRPIRWIPALGIKRLSTSTSKKKAIDICNLHANKSQNNSVKGLTSSHTLLD